MKTYRFFRYDIRQGFSKYSWNMTVVVLLVLLSCMDLYRRKYNMCIMVSEPMKKGTYMDYLLYLLGGMEKYCPQKGGVFLFPVKWLFLHLYLVYTTLHYPFKDLHCSLGELLIVNGQSRKAWWRAKCLWNMTYILLLFGIIFGTVLLFCLLTGESISSVLSADRGKYFLSDYTGVGK